MPEESADILRDLVSSAGGGLVDLSGPSDDLLADESMER
jgi:hypothetical protein